MLSVSCLAYGHDVITTKVTFDREIPSGCSECSLHFPCHREGGTAFSLETYKVARPWAKAIGEEVLDSGGCRRGAP